VPGVPGFAGGYPFALKKCKFALRLPPDIDLPKAMAHNKTAEFSDGLDIGDGVRFSDKANRALAAAGFEYARGFAFEEWYRVRDAMLRLRDRLRSQLSEKSNSAGN